MLIRTSVITTHSLRIVKLSIIRIVDIKYMSNKNSNMSPQDIVVLLKIIASDGEPWVQIPMAQKLGLAQSEMSRSIARSKYAGLLDDSGRKVRRLALMEFIQYGLPYALPIRPSSIVRGVPTSHSAQPLKDQIKSQEDFVWPYSKGASLEGANLIKTNFNGADLSSTNLTKADLSNANLCNTNLSNANLKDTVFKNTKINIKTTFPTNFDSSKHDLIIRVDDSCLEVEYP